MEELKKHPSDIELEQAVLGAILIEKDCLPNCIDRLNVNLFDTESHKIILDSIFRPVSDDVSRERVSLFSRHIYFLDYAGAGCVRHSGALHDAGCLVVLVAGIRNVGI